MRVHVQGYVAPTSALFPPIAVFIFVIFVLPLSVSIIHIVFPVYGSWLACLECLSVSEPFPTGATWVLCKSSSLKKKKKSSC